MKENRAFLFAHAALLCVVLVGFARTFYLKDWFARNDLDLPLLVHGAILTSWFALTVLQAAFIETGHRARHRRVAWLAAIVAPGVVLSAAWINTRLAGQLHSARDPENLFVWGNYMTLVAFVVLLAAAIFRRHQPAAHRRLVVLASICIVGPAFARFAFWPLFGFGVAGGPPFAIGGLLLLVSTLVGYDLVNLRKVHAATLGGVVALFAILAVGFGLALSGAGFGLLQRFQVVSPESAVERTHEPGAGPS